jgi:hypothetical protein
MRSTTATGIEIRAVPTDPSVDVARFITCVRWPAVSGLARSGTRQLMFSRHPGPLEKTLLALPGPINATSTSRRAEGDRDDHQRDRLHALTLPAAGTRVKDPVTVNCENRVLHTPPYACPPGLSAFSRLGRPGCPQTAATGSHHTAHDSAV